MRGTLLNTGTVAVGASLGLVSGKYLSPEYQTVALHGLGLVVVGLGIKMFLASKNPLITAASVSLGGVLGVALGLQKGLDYLAHFAQTSVGGSGTFAQGLITSFVLFCVGPMTLLGCFEDAIENKIEILSLKSTMDGISSFFLAAATGAGVLFTAVLLFIFQGAITVAAKPLRKYTANENLINEVTGVGGSILIATGIGLMGLKELFPVNFLPALILAPIFVWIQSRFPSKSKPSPSEDLLPLSIHS